MIISFDPGISTGIVLADDINYQTREFRIVGKGVLMYPERAKILDMLTRYADRLEAIIVEDFLLYRDQAMAQVNSRFETVKVIERIQVYAEQLAIDHLIKMQLPALRRSASVPKGDHRAALGNNRHTDAAYQHLRYYIFMQKHSGNDLVTPKP